MRAPSLILLLLLAACSKATPEMSPERDQTKREASGPDVAVTATPGMALNYQYDFRLPAQRIAAVQEQHAAQCEALGVTRCRITGLHYQVGGRHDIAASLSLKLAPAGARAFGKQGITVVTGQGGMLISSDITSVDAGNALVAADDNTASLANEQEVLARQLAQPGLGSTERSQLQDRQASLRDAVRATATERANAALLLASTPMEFRYTSGETDARLSDGPFVAALKDGWANVRAGTLILLTLFISLIPWAAGIALIVWLWRRFGKRLGLDRRISDED